MTPRDAALGSLGLLSLALLVVIAMEAIETPAPAATAAAPVAASALPATEVDDTASSLPIILARPLFALDRRPSASGSTVGAVSDDMPRLSGILIDQSRRRAIFQPSGDAKPVSLAEGEQVAGWQIQKIAVDGVTLTGPKGTETLLPKPDPALAAAAADNPSPIAPGQGGQPAQANPRQFLPGGMQLPPGVPNPFAGPQPAPPQPQPNPQPRPIVPQPRSRQPGGAPAAPNRR